MARSAAEAYITGLAPYLSAVLQNRQLQQQKSYQQGELGLQGQQIGQTGEYQRGILGIQQGQLDVARQAKKAQAVQMLTQAAQADPLNMTGVMDKALQYYRSTVGEEPDMSAIQQGGGTPQALMAPGGGMAGPNGAEGVAPQLGPQPQQAPQPPTGAQGGGMGVMTPTSDLSQALRAGVQGPQLLEHMPIALRNMVDQILSGRASPPSLSARNPQSRQLMMLASAVDPSFDATQYGMRFNTAKAFASGQQGNAIRSVNQTMSHVGHLLQNINELDNYGGPLPGVVNSVSNYLGEHVAGQSVQQNFEQTVGAVASELRKVFAASGGGSLTELKNWEENFPLNASPTQQRSYLKNGMDLLGGAISALQDQYRRGFGANADVTKLIAPQAKKVLDYIQTMDPRTGKPMGGGQPSQGGQVLHAVNPQTGQRIVSQDGGQTWQQAQ
jgi:hypothetical protein